MTAAVCLPAVSAVTMGPEDGAWLGLAASMTDGATVTVEAGDEADVGVGFDEGPGPAPEQPAATSTMPIVASHPVVLRIALVAFIVDLPSIGRDHGRADSHGHGNTGCQETSPRPGHERWPFTVPLDAI